MKYVVTFKKGILHPYYNLIMRDADVNYGIRIIADNVSQVREVLNHSYRDLWEHVHDESKIRPGYITDIVETLKHKKSVSDGTKIV